MLFVMFVSRHLVLVVYVNRGLVFSRLGNLAFSFKINSDRSTVFLFDLFFSSVDTFCSILTFDILIAIRRLPF